MTRDLIPIVPASHYICGGVQVDTVGQTSLTYLYACGECTCSGLHGANRLASNSLLEGVVYADNIYHEIKGKADELEWREEIPEWDEKNVTNTDEMGSHFPQFPRSAKYHEQLCRNCSQ